MPGAALDLRVAHVPLVVRAHGVHVHVEFAVGEPAVERDLLAQFRAHLGGHLVPLVVGLEALALRVHFDGSARIVVVLGVLVGGEGRLAPRAKARAAAGGKRHGNQ